MSPAGRLEPGSALTSPSSRRSQEKTKLAAQPSLNVLSECVPLSLPTLQYRAPPEVIDEQKQAEDDVELDGKRLKDRLATSTQRIQTLEAELSRARAIANGVKSDQRHLEAQLQARDEACEMRINQLTRETDAKLARQRLEAEAAVRRAEITHASVEQDLCVHLPQQAHLALHCAR